MKQNPNQHLLRSNRLRISPKGVVTLPAEALKILNIPKDHSIEVGVELRSDGLVLYSPADKNKPRKRVSKGGQVQLNSAARKTLYASSLSESVKNSIIIIAVENQNQIVLYGEAKKDG